LFRALEAKVHDLDLETELKSQIKLDLKTAKNA